MPLRILSEVIRLERKRERERERREREREREERERERERGEREREREREGHWTLESAWRFHWPGDSALLGVLTSVEDTNLKSQWYPNMKAEV